MVQKLIVLIAILLGGLGSLLAWPRILLGVLLTIVDTVAGIKLRSGDFLSFSKWYLPSLGLLNIGGSLVEVSATVGASIVVANLLSIIFLYRLQRVRKPLRSGRQQRASGFAVELTGRASSVAGGDE